MGIERAAGADYAHAMMRLDAYCRREGFKGWDNFDGLNSLLFNRTPLYRNWFLRLAWIQFFKRSPVNLRRLTLVPRGYNAKGVALFLSGLVLNGDLAGAAELRDVLPKLACSGYPGACWGYNFDWQARNFLTPLGTPNAVVTVFVMNALLDYHEATGDEDARSLAIAGCDFLLGTLVLHEDQETLCFGYMPGSDTRVHNVNMMVAAALARVSVVTGDTLLMQRSRKAMAYSLRALSDDFSWRYGESSFQGFIDNFHTGFNIVSLKKWMEYAGDFRWLPQLEGAYQYFLEKFWLPDGCPRYYHDTLYPIDIHCSAQGILTCLEMASLSQGSVSQACLIAKWAIDNMQDSTGYFYYQRTRWFLNRIPYMRWSQAWMYYALSRLRQHLSVAAP